MSFTKIKFTKWIIEDKRTNDSHNYKDGQEYLNLLQIALAFFFFFLREDTERTQTIKHRKNEFVAHLYKSWTRNHINRFSYNRLTLNSTHFSSEEINAAKAFHKLLKIFQKVSGNFSKSCSKVTKRQSKVAFCNESCSKVARKNKNVFCSEAKICKLYNKSKISKHFSAT